MSAANAAGQPHSRIVVDDIERLIQVDVGRRVTALFEAARGGLWAAASALAIAPAGGVGLITGFYVPQGSPPAAETDGPVGAALLAKGLEAVGIPCRLATDEPCRGACVAALTGAGLSGVPVDAAGVPAMIETWRRAQITHAISIERCGRSADGAPRNMRGLDIGSYTAPLDELFTAGPWETIAIGDGGNEIGMGSLPRELIAQYVDHGGTIACVTPTRHLIVAGVSNWGAYGLLGALAALRPDWRERLLVCLDETIDKGVLEATVNNGPAVDGVSRLRTMTVDNLDMAIHHSKLREIRALVKAGHDV
ncbi:MAG TPA: glutamate cyclase domain-containing protein [Stellaceae bacterium]|nr:glutamate cyclase domain-containing protein [Stellaceae bacterium]